MTIDRIVTLIYRDGSKQPEIESFGPISEWSLEEVKNLLRECEHIFKECQLFVKQCDELEAIK